MTDRPDFVYDEQLQPESFFDAFLLDIFSKNLPNYQDCPPSINIQGTSFQNILLDFRTEIDKRIDSFVSGATYAIDIGEVSSENAAEEASGHIRDAMRTEFDQIISLNPTGKPVVSSIEMGGIGAAAVGIGLSPDETVPIDLNQRVHIHNHSFSGQTFSPPDLALVFQGIDPETYFGVKPSKPLPTNTLLVVSTTKGYFLCFPTQETTIPSQQEAGDEGIEKESPKYKETLRDKYKEIWDLMLAKFGREKLQDFLGEKSEWRAPSVFPQEVGELGIELIALEDILRLCKKHRLGLYCSDKSCQEFSRVDTHVDLFPTLQQEPTWGKDPLRIRVGPIYEAYKQGNRIPAEYLNLPVLTLDSAESRRAKEVFQRYDEEFFSVEGWDEIPIIEGRAMDLQQATNYMLKIASEAKLDFYYGTNIEGVALAKRTVDAATGFFPNQYFSLNPDTAVDYSLENRKDPRKGLEKMPIVVQVDLKSLLDLGVRLYTREVYTLPYDYFGGMDVLQARPELLVKIFRPDPANYLRWHAQEQFDITSSGKIVDFPPTTRK